jgi:dihydrofolate synthase/folylpolyglutamate synthase
MMKNIQEVESALAKYIPATRQTTGRDITVGRTQLLMKYLGDPQDRLRIIHVAGTSGKTSTSYYLASLLMQSGQKAGLTVSPHMVSITERFQVGLVPISEGDFCNEMSQFLGLISGAPVEPTYFELLTAFAYYYFDKIGVDFAVIETGLGGLHDATNVAGKEDKICVITDIGIDHTHVLGNTIESIAFQKAGIIHKGNHVFMRSQSEKAQRIVAKKAYSQSAVLHLVDDAPTEIRLPKFQARNWSLAKRTHNHITKKYGLKSLDAEQIENTQKVLIPGRIEHIKIGQHTLTLDGAHNDQKMRAFVDSYDLATHVTVIIAVKNDKDFTKMLRSLKPIASTLVVTEFYEYQDTPIRATDTSLVASAAKSLGYKNVIVEPDPNKALALALDMSTEYIIATGSLYLVSELKKGLNAKS